LVFLMGAVSALASTIAIFNPGFETTPAGGALSPGGMGAQNDVPGWGTFGDFPREAWPPAGMFPSGTPDGVQALLAYSNGGVDQNTATVFTANVTYTYSVWVGLDAGSPRVPWTLLLYANGSGLVAFTTGSPLSLVDGGWVLSSVSFTPGPGDSHLGQTFYLQFGVGNNGDQIDHLFFDDVSATAIPFGSGSTPEPAGLFPIGLAALVMLEAWRRRRRRGAGGTTTRELAQNERPPGSAGPARLFC